MKKKIADDEIDVFGIIITIWNNKWKIFLITLLTVVIMGGVYSKKKPSFTATTEIRPISVFEEFQYAIFNSVKDEVNLDTYIPKQNFRDKNNSSNYFLVNRPKSREYTFLFKEEINKTYLLNLFIDKLKQGETFRNAIKKFNLIDKDIYKDNQSYEDAVTRLASSIIFLPPQDGPEAHDVRHYWQIKFETENITAWKQILQFIEKPTNEEIRLYLNFAFKNYVLNEKKLKRYKLEYIDDNINSAIENYEKEILSRIAFLKEQAQIARTLNIKDNILIGPGFSPNEENISNLDNDNSYYARGYEMIEKEIELIQSRTQKNLFIKEMIELEKIRKDLNLNEDIEKLQSFFNDTPLTNLDNFKAANVAYLSTSFRTNHQPMKRMILLFCIIGVILGICYVLLEDVIKMRR
tara:strand:+ start:40 stop:1260 length:1221 start_codon:yes stop_codon:yes gene_type:complete